MIEIKKLKHLSVRHQKLYDTALKAVEQRNFPYAIELLRNLLKQEPGVLEVREKLREIEFQRIGGESNPTRQMLAPVVTAIQLIKGRLLLKKEQFIEALDNAEAAMKFDPTAITSCLLLANAALAADAPAIAKQTLLSARKFHPKNIMLLNTLAKAYSKMGCYREAVECYQEIVALAPKNEKYKTEFEESKKFVSIDSEDPEQPLSFMMNEQPSFDPEALEKEIKVQLNSVQKEETAENRKKLGDLYAMSKDYERALENYNKAIEIAPVMDAALDYAVSKVLFLQYDQSIAEWENYLNNGNINDEEKAEARENIENLNQQKTNLLIQRARDRHQRNPHSAEMHFELGKLLWTFGKMEEAKEHFQQLKNHNQFGDQALLFLGKCDFQSGQFDHAISSLNALIDKLPRMNQAKKSSYYTLAECYKAKRSYKEIDHCYKAIYAVDENYKNIGDLIDKMYQKQLLEGAG